MKFKKQIISIALAGMLLFSNWMPSLPATGATALSTSVVNTSVDLPTSVNVDVVETVNSIVDFVTPEEAAAIKAAKAEAEAQARAKEQAEAEAQAKAKKAAATTPKYGRTVTVMGSTASDYVKSNYSNMGKYKLSFYCPCYRCNGNSHAISYSGTKLTEGRTIAVDKRVIALGTKVHIDGFGDFIAEDTGSGIKGNRIDIYVSTHAQALKLGIKYANVYVG